VKKCRVAALALLAVISFVSISVHPSNIPITQVTTHLPSPGTDDPLGVHLTYPGDPTSTITVTWQTTFPSSGDLVLYDIVARGGIPSLYEFNSTGIHHTYAGASGYIHDVELTSLTPSTVYFFICGGAGNYSTERSFETASASATTLRFVIGGDSRTNVSVRTQVSQAMNHFSPSFALHCGDMIDDGTNQTQWDVWFSDVQANWVGQNGLTIPVIPCLGNHEVNSTNYYEQFPLPGNEQWYYYDCGSRLRIIVMNSEAFPTQIAVDQANWVETVLSSTPSSMWKIVMFHRNVYYAGGHPNATDLQQYWVPIFSKYHVDVVVQGHSHYYHRTKPMSNNSVVSSFKNGTLYLTSGGWGAPLQDYYSQPYSAYGSKTYHFVLATLFVNDTLHLEAKDLNGQTFDDIWLDHGLRNWSFPNGMHLQLWNASIAHAPFLNDTYLSMVINAPNGTTSTIQIYCANRGPPSSISGMFTWGYDNDTKMLTASIMHSNQSVTIEVMWTTPGSTGPGPQGSTDLTLTYLVLSLIMLLIAGVVLPVLLAAIKEVRREKMPMKRQHSVIASA